MGVYSASHASPSSEEHQHGGGDMLSPNNYRIKEGDHSTVARMLSGHRVEQRLHHKFNLVLLTMFIVVCLQGLVLFKLAKKGRR